MKVAKLPVDPGPAAWNVILPAAPQRPALDETRSFDLLVIGAGFAGLSAAKRARELAPDARLAVLEARRVADGPAGRNSGFMIDLPHDLASDDYGGALERDKKQTKLNRAAIAFAASAAARYGMDDEAFDPCGKINAAASDAGLAHNRDYAKHLDALGEPHELYDAAAMRAITGIDYYQGGLYTPGAAMIQPALYVRRLAGGLERDGVAIFEESPVTALEREGGAWRATTPRGAILADKVVLAVNGHANSFGLYKGRLMHVFTYASMTRALDDDEIARLGGRARWGATPADPMGTTVRRISGRGGDRIVVRNRFTYDPSMEVDDRRVARVGEDHERAFRARFPILKDVAFEHRWGGRLCLSWNGVPAFGEVEPGLVSAVCQNGLGTAQGTLAGMMAAAHVFAPDDPLLALFRDHEQPRRLPPEPFAKIGATLQIRWRERRAGKEF